MLVYRLFREVPPLIRTLHRWFLNCFYTGSGRAQQAVSLCKTPLLYIPSHPMHALPLFHHTPCMHSPHSIPAHAAHPYSIPPHACPPLILSHPMCALPLFYPTSCMPSPYSIPAHAWPRLILSQPMHDLPLFYPAHACPSPILSHLMHDLPLFYPSPCTPSRYSLPSHTCHPSILIQPIHALQTPCHIHLEGMFLLWNLLTLSILSSSFTLLGNFEHHFITLRHLNDCCFHSHELTICTSYSKSTVKLHKYHIITTYIVYHYSSVNITHSST